MIAVENELPRTVEALNQLVDNVTVAYGLPDTDDTYEAIATMILHMPSTKATASLSQFGEGVIKQLANKVAYDKCREFAQKRDAREKADLEAKLKLSESADLQGEKDVSSVDGTKPI